MLTIHNLYSFNRTRIYKNWWVDKNGEEITKNVSYILPFTDSARFMTSSWSNLVNNLPEGLHRIRCILGDEGKKCENCGIKYKYCHCFF